MSVALNYFPFEYISEDERLLSSAKVVYLDPQKVIIKGVLEKAAYNPVRNGFVNMLGFFLESDGIEYGSISVSPESIYGIYTRCNCADVAKIHVTQFALQFR